MKILKQSSLLVAVQEEIQVELGDFFVRNYTNSIDDIYKESDCFTPIIFILQKGADPTGQIKQLGDREGFAMYQKLFPISLGQGQGQRASNLIQSAKEEGHWVLIENCHLTRTWMIQLEKEVQNLQDSTKQNLQPHKDFRLFLTSMPASYFSSQVLQNSTKVTTEPPQGIKANTIQLLKGYQESEEISSNMGDLFGRL